MSVVTGNMWHQNGVTSQKEGEEPLLEHKTKGLKQTITCVGRKTNRVIKILKEGKKEMWLAMTEVCLCFHLFQLLFVCLCTQLDWCNKDSSGWSKEKRTREARTAWSAAHLPVWLFIFSPSLCVHILVVIARPKIDSFFWFLWDRPRPIVSLGENGSLKRSSGESQALEKTNVGVITQLLRPNAQSKSCVCPQIKTRIAWQMTSLLTSDTGSSISCLRRALTS